MQNEILPRAPLTRDAILRAAVDIADHRGIESVSMRNVAAALNVQAMSLYNYVSNKSDLLAGMAGYVLSMMNLSLDENASWQDGLRSILRAYRTLASQHPHLLGIVMEQPLTSPEALEPMSIAFQTLARLELDSSTTLDLFEICASFVGGFSLNEISRHSGDRPEFPDADSLDDTFGTTRDILRQANPNPDRTFELGCDLLVAGIESMLKTRALTQTIAAST